MNTIYKAVLVVCFGILETFVAVALYATPVRAETRVGGLMDGDAVWTKEGSPYLLTENLTVMDGVHLTIEPGVSVGVASEAATEYASDGPAIFIAGAHLSAEGSSSQHIIFNKISGLFVTSSSLSNGSADLGYTDLVGGSRISFEDSYGTISTSTISGTDIGIYSHDSIVLVRGSKISGNDIGVYVQPHSVFQIGKANSYYGSSGFGTGGIGNALDGVPDLYESSSFTVEGSSLSGNVTRSINNISDLTVQAKDNWWGSASGPVMDGTNSIRGNAEYSPWLSAEPNFDAGPEPSPVVCCSSVLFIPGMEGSRLYRTELNPNVPLLSYGAITTNQLWEPMTNSDVVKLRLNSNGSSTDPSIYSGGPIDKALGFVDIYGGFMKSIDDMVMAGKIGEWRAFGYDWRKPIDQVVLGYGKKATTTENLIKIVEDLASRSKTGKVSIVAHSNGGLVAKYLVKALADAGRASLIDSVISVAVPYLGTPAAIPALLHGDGQSLLGGLIASAANMRKLGANMPSAYSLLPSRDFFTKFFGSTVAYASTTANTFDKQSVFMAQRANQPLLNAADIIHGLLDPFVWPATIARWALVGWNNSKTPVRTEYPSGKYEAVKSSYGDGTVIANSAAAGSGKVIPIDLKTQSFMDNRDINHVNILEASTTKSAIATIISNPAGIDSSAYSSNPAEQNIKVQNELSRLPGVTVGDMDWNALEAAEEANRKQLQISTHSPVKLHIYDSHGNHTGEVPLPPEIAAQVEEGLYRFSETKIPDSTFDVHECVDQLNNDCETYISLPDNGETYTVVAEGAGVGTFTLDIERIRATTTVETVEWSGVPTTQMATATTTIVSDGRFVVPAGNSVASSTTLLRSDLNGDGSTDSSFKPGRVKDSADRLDFIKKRLSRFMGVRVGHMRLRDFGRNDRDVFRDCVDEFVKRFGRS